ncbi:hypothetical protein FACS1894176_04360 [Bacteroidia bacterium]|nr:hypothetical protein FACS1894176_04360 [Bacteroidia bacterium]
MNTNLKQEIISTSPINPTAMPTLDRHSEDQRRKQIRLAYQEWKETKAINDNGAFIIENTQDSLLTNNNMYTKQMKLIREKGKQYIIGNFHALAEYKHPLAEQHNEMILTADGKSIANPVIKVVKNKNQKKGAKIVPLQPKYALAS